MENLDGFILVKIRYPEDIILAVEPTRRPANLPDGLISNREQSPNQKCTNSLLANESNFDKGYDSDGPIDPFFGDVHAEGDQAFEKSPATIGAPSSNQSNSNNDKNKLWKKIKTKTTTLQQILQQKG